MHQPRSQASRRVAILSIDGGGVRGIIPAIVLERLEELLQAADYFDLIAGTSTGGLIATMLALPSKDNINRPRFTAENITDFYFQKSPKIFPQNWCSWIRNIVSMFCGPKYSAEGLETILRDELENTRLDETLKDLLIPAYDIKLIQPVIFSTSEARDDVVMNARLRDVCRGTSAAPTYFAPYFFQTKTPEGECRSFDVVDGGVVANNPAHLAITHVQQQYLKGNTRLCGRMEPSEKRPHESLLLLSLGTGKPKSPATYYARDASKWGTVSWMIGEKVSTPLLNIIMGGSDDLVNYNVSALFKTDQCSRNYLRIQSFDLEGDTLSMDYATDASLRELARIGKELLHKPIAEIDMNRNQRASTLRSISTYGKALEDFAKELIKEKHARHDEF